VSIMTSPRFEQLLPNDRMSVEGRTAELRTQHSLVGDAELDEDAVWEAIVDPGTADLGKSSG
jgi:hypothetical protein